MNIYDISARAGVSIATVSRVLNGSHKVSEATRRKILNIIEETGYIPGSGRGKSPSKSRTVGIICSTLLSHGNALIVEKLLHKLGAAGFETDLVLCGPEPAARRRAVEGFADKKIAALVIQCGGQEYGGADCSYIAASRFPVILLNAMLDAPGVYCACCDLPAAIRSVTGSLIKKGRRRPMFLFPAMSGDFMLMLEGFKSACAAGGVEPPPEYIHICPNAAGAGEYFTSFLKSGLRADAVITADDYSALAVVCAATKAGLSLPDELEVTGCGKSGISKLSPVPFATIDCREEELASHAVNCVISLSKGAEAATRTVFPAIITKP